MNSYFSNKTLESAGHAAGEGFLIFYIFFKKLCRCNKNIE